MDMGSALSLMADRGYQVMSRTGDNTQYHMANINIGLNATLKESGGSVQLKLYFSHKLFVTTTGYFQIDHSKYYDLFQNPLILIKEQVDVL